MAKKIVPANPDTKTTAKADDKTATRKTACGKTHPRKTGRKTAGFHSGH
jgi:hypothetical protein